jgi:hypothetical protein
METLDEQGILWMRQFTLSHNFHVPQDVYTLLTSISWYTEDREHYEFLTKLAHSKYSKEQIRQICTQIPLCYTFFESSDKKRENLVIYTLDISNRITRWGSYYPNEEPRYVGNHSDFDMIIPELLKHDFVFIPNSGNGA